MYISYTDIISLIYNINVCESEDPELQELEERGGGYLSNDDDDNRFTIDDDGDKHTVEI